MFLVVMVWHARRVLRHYHPIMAGHVRHRYVRRRFGDLSPQLARLRDGLKPEGEGSNDPKHRSHRTQHMLDIGESGLRRNRYAARPERVLPPET